MSPTLRLIRCLERGKKCAYRPFIAIIPVIDRTRPSRLELVYIPAVHQPDRRNQIQAHRPSASAHTGGDTADQHTANAALRPRSVQHNAMQGA